MLGIKTHVGRKNPPNPKWPAKYDRVVVLVRDPFDALLAEFNRQHSQNQTGFASDEKFEQHWNTYLAKTIEFWKGFHTFFKAEYKSHQVMFVSYEKLTKNLIEELKNVLAFLGYSLPKNVADCVKVNREGLFHRVKPVVDQMKYFNAEQKVVLTATRDDVYKKIGIKNWKK